MVAFDLAVTITTTTAALADLCTTVTTTDTCPYSCL